MQNYPFEKRIAISQLLLDTQNPRLPEIQETQYHAIKTMANTQGDKIVALAAHVVNNGSNPSSLPIVMPSSDNDGMYYVLDGNRRLAALKLLESPTLAEGILHGAKLQKLKRLSTEFHKNPIAELNCVVFDDRDTADVWIQLLHRGQQQGAGLVEWDGQVAARYDARKKSKPNTALEVLDFVKENAQLSEKTQNRIKLGKFPITNLQRLLNTPYVRRKLGVDISEDGSVLVSYPEEEVLKGLARVVDDLGSKRITVTKIKSQEQRIDYINDLSESELPDISKALSVPRPLASSALKSGINKTTSKSKKQYSYRTVLIPRDCKLNIEQHRINKIYGELKRLSVDDFPNAGAVMLRVFIELSIDYYLEHSVGWPEQQIDNSKLAQKLTAVANHFESNGIMTSSQLASIRKAAAGQTLLVASVKTMHGYIHNRHFSPVASEMKTAWDDLQPFMEKLWENTNSA